MDSRAGSQRLAQRRCAPLLAAASARARFDTRRECRRARDTLKLLIDLLWVRSGRYRSRSCTACSRSRRSARSGPLAVSVRRATPRARPWASSFARVLSATNGSDVKRNLEASVVVPVESRKGGHESPDFWRVEALMRPCAGAGERPAAGRQSQEGVEPESDTLFLRQRHTRGREATEDQASVPLEPLEPAARHLAFTVAGPVTWSPALFGVWHSHAGWCDPIDQSMTIRDHRRHDALSVVQPQPSRDADTRSGAERAPCARMTTSATARARQPTVRPPPARR
jgi:hypothetical protein